MKKSVCLGILLFLMLFRADYVTEGAKSGLLLWYSSVVPALFPFMVLSSLIVAGGGISAVMSPFYLVLGPILGLSESGCYVLIAGLTCGYPMGAKTCADFLKEGRISKREGKFLMAICNHPSPMFLLGYVYPFFREQISPGLLLFFVYGPVAVIALLAFLIYRPDGYSGFGSRRMHGIEHQKEEHLSADEAILSAVEILCKIGGYLMLFSIAIIFLRNIRSLPAFIRLLLISSMEMTTGIREAAAFLPFPFSGAVSCAALTFGGFSGLFQTKAVIGNEKKAGLSIRQYFLWKVLHGICSAGLFLFLEIS